MLTLFTSKGSVSVASAIMLKETETEYKLEFLDFSQADQTKKSYLNINPKGRVPALVTPHGVLMKIGAILEYVAPDFIPLAAYSAARVREIIHYLASTMHVNHAHKMRGARWADDPVAVKSMVIKVPETMAKSCAYLEKIINGPYIFGSKITIADAHLFTIAQWLKGDEVEIKDYPKLARFEREFATRPSVACVRARGLL
jgi:glutathione S-transferase|tara:strand:- start:4480 stop:5079 length:600 start_codon:yes stop_codon:yes gene_type:complete